MDELIEIGVSDPSSLEFKLGLVLVLGKSGLIFPKLTNITIHVNSTLSGNTRQNSEYKIMIAKAENKTK